MILCRIKNVLSRSCLKTNCIFLIRRLKQSRYKSYIINDIYSKLCNIPSFYNIQRRPSYGHWLTINYPLWMANISKWVMKSRFYSQLHNTLKGHVWTWESSKSRGYFHRTKYNTFQKKFNFCNCFNSQEHWELNTKRIYCKTFSAFKAIHFRILFLLTTIIWSSFGKGCFLFEVTFLRVQLGTKLKCFFNCAFKTFHFHIVHRVHS